MADRGDGNNPTARFESLVGRIFEANGFGVEFNRKIVSNDRRRNFEVDLILQWKNTVTTAVEVKLFRSRAPNLGDLARACHGILEVQASISTDHALVVANLRENQMPFRGALPKGVIFVSLDDLFQYASGNLDLLSELTEIDRELSSALREFDRVPDFVDTNERMELSRFQMAAADNPTILVPQSRKGGDLAEELRSVPTGGKVREIKLPSGRIGVPWRLFEDICLDALKYIFEDILGNWKKQEAVSGEANRFDAFAKIIGDDVFCRTLIEDFRSRYILFEFKNYSGRIKPNNIHITEKYLFPTALRATAIIISPKGFVPGSVHATHGALRDAGKLMLDIKTTDLCELLEDKDNGNTPSVKMESHLDTFLQQVGR